MGRIHTLVTTIAADVAPETFQDRVKAAHAGRWVSITPSPEDGTAPLIAHLPTPQALACYALDQAVKVCGARPSR